MLANPLGLRGIAFLEFSAPTPEGLAGLHRSFLALGFSRLQRHRHLKVDLYRQGDVRLLLSYEKGSHAGRYATDHGTCVTAVGLSTTDADLAAEECARRDAELNTEPTALNLPAVYGVGGVLHHFVDDGMDWDHVFLPHPEPQRVPGRGITSIDHFATRVERGTVRTCANFYKGVFGFTDTSHRCKSGDVTGAMMLRSPCEAFYVPLVETRETTGNLPPGQSCQGPGVHHVALRTDDIAKTLAGLRRARLPLHGFDQQDAQLCGEAAPSLEALVRHGVLAERRSDGEIYQVFSDPIIGLGRWEIIQRTPLALPHANAWIESRAPDTSTTSA